MATYKIVSHGGTGLPLNVYGTGTITSRRNVCIWTDTGSVDQQWAIDSLGSNQTVRSVNNQSYMLNANRSGSTWNCDVYTLNADCYVNFISLGNNVYRIQLKSDTTKYLTALGTSSNSDVRWAVLDTASNAQSWKITEVSGGSVNPGTGSVTTLIAAANACIGKNLAQCAKYFGVSNPNCEWCAWFVRQCGIKANMNFGTSNLASQVRGVNGNVSFSATTPKVGDLALIDTHGGSSVGHVGIITAITGNKITTVEGNMSGSVTTSIVKNASYDASGYSSTFGRIVYIGKNS